MARYTYVISDIHGQFDALMRLMEKIYFIYEDELYIIGDIIDRGRKSLECIQWIQENDNVLAMLGNHELQFLEEYSQNKPATYNMLDEARKTLSETELKRMADWICDMPECRIIKVGNQNFFLHHTQALTKEYLNEKKLSNRMFPDYDRYKKYRTIENTEIISIMGHIPTMQMRLWNGEDKSSVIWKNLTGCIYDIDCGAGYPEKGGCLGCLRLNDLRGFYVEI